MADAKKGPTDSGEFADFMADISEEIALRVQSLDKPEVKVEERKEPARPDPGTILEWENIADRIIEEMR